MDNFFYPDFNRDSNGWKILANNLWHNQEQPVREFSEWLELNQPELTRSDALIVAGLLTLDYGKPYPIDAIPDTVKPQLKRALFNHLQRLKYFYQVQSAGERRERISRQRVRQIVADDEMQLIKELRAEGFSIGYSSDAAKKYRSLLTLITFTTERVITNWINTPYVKRWAILNEMLSLRDTIRAEPLTIDPFEDEEEAYNCST